MGNASSSEVAMSLHVYSPAYHQCHVFSEVVPEKRKVSISTAYGAIYPFMERKIVETTSDCYDLKTFLCQLKCALTHQNFDKVNSLVDSLRFSPEFVFFLRCSFLTRSHTFLSFQTVEPIHSLQS